MAAALIQAYVQLEDANGAVYSGAKANTYTVGTTTPLTTYSDYAMTTPHTNPVAADSAGVFPPIYAPTTANVKIVLTTSASAPLRTIEEVPTTATPASASIDTAQLVNDAVTNAKLANMATKTIKGRNTAATGDPEDLTALVVANMLLANASFGLKAISGWAYANGTDATNDIDIAAGAGADSTGAYWIKGAALTKQLDAAWAVGTNAGGLDTGAIANSGYFIWAIARSDTGVVDALFSTSATAPTMPASYDYKRLIGYIERSAGAILAFLADELSGGGLRYRWDSPRLDGNNVALTTSYSTLALSVPAGLRVLAFGNAVGPTGGNIINVRPVGAQDGPPSHTASPLATAGSTGTSTTTGSEWREFTDTSRTIEWASNASANAYLATKGFEWARR